MFFGHGRKCFVGALQNSLRADVNPATRGHLAVHHQAGAVQFVEALPIIPVAHQIGIADQHARRMFMRAKHRHRLAGLHQQRFIVLQRAQRAHNGVKAFPVARRFPRAAINHQILRLLRHIRIKIVHQHAQRRFLLPAFAGKLRAASRPERTFINRSEDV